MLANFIGCAVNCQHSLHLVKYGSVLHTYILTYLTYLLIYLLTHLLTPWNRVLLEKLTGSQLVKKFPAFHGTRRFVTAFTSTRYLSLSRASSIRSMLPQPTSWRTSLILSSSICTWVSKYDPIKEVNYQSVTSSHLWRSICLCVVTIDWQ